MPHTPRPVPVPLPPAAPAGIELWLLTWTGADQPELGRLTAEEQLRVAMYRRPYDARPFAFTRVALRRLLGERLDCDPLAVPLHRDDSGKPFVHRIGAPLFSVGHVSGHALIALSTAGEVGVDLELPQPETVWRDVAPVFLSADEQRLCDSLSFADCMAAWAARWSLKEAVLKAAGIGVVDHLTDMTLERATDGWRVRAHQPLPFPPHAVQAWDIALPSGLTGALAWIDPAQAGSGSQHGGRL